MQRPVVFIIIILLAIAFLFISVKFFVPGPGGPPFLGESYAQSGGIAGLPKDKICDCMGREYSYYPEDCSDCMTTYYCSGELRNCRCLNAGKYADYFSQRLTGSLEDYAYDPC